LGIVNLSSDIQSKQLGDADVTYVIIENRSGFFKFAYNENIVAEAKETKCPASRDLFAPSPGDLFLTIVYIDPTNANRVEVKRQL
jgi:hypothetical protein